MATPHYQAIRTSRFERRAAAATQQRPWLIAPILVFIPAMLVAAGYERWRTAAVGALSIASLARHVIEALSARRRAADAGHPFVGRVAMIMAQVTVVALTGGLRSPLVVSLFPVIALQFAEQGRVRRSVVMVAAVGAAVVAMAVVPSHWLGPRVADPYYAVLVAGTLLFAFAMLFFGIGSIAAAYADIGAELDRMREQVVAEATGRARSLQQVAATVAHELKNPLSSVKGLLQLLARGTTDDRTSERLSVMEREVERMEGVLKDYLSFSRPLEATRTEALDLGRLCAEMATLCEGRAGDAGIALWVERPTHGPIAEGDRRHLQAALLNLVSNALDATPPGGRVVIRVAADAAVARIEIEDNGSGISVEDLPRVGTPYFSRRSGGTGLGVVLARAALAQHGGTLDYSSERGRGTTATVTMPRKEDG